MVIISLCRLSPFPPRFGPVALPLLIKKTEMEQRKNMYKQRIKILTVIALLACVAGARGAAMVEFTLSLNTTVDSGSGYTNYHASEAGTSTQFAIGFQIDITSVDGVAVDLGPIASFCSEIQEPISTKTYQFEAKHLNELSAGQAGVSGSASASIPEGGIGDLRASRVAYLFDQYYISDQLSAWTQNQDNPTLHAFQLAVWELTHDTDMDIFSTAGDIHVGSQSNTLRNNALSLAQDYLDDVDTAGIDESYVSTKFKFWALTSDSGNGVDGNPGFQDVILATEIGSVEEEELSPYLPAPEPGTASLVLLAALGLLARRRRPSY